MKILKTVQERNAYFAYYPPGRSQCTLIACFKGAFSTVSHILTDSRRWRPPRGPQLHADEGGGADDVANDHNHSQLNRLDLGSAGRGGRISPIKILPAD